MSVIVQNLRTREPSDIGNEAAALEIERLTKELQEVRDMCAHQERFKFEANERAEKAELQCTAMAEALEYTFHSGLLNGHKQWQIVHEALSNLPQRVKDIEAVLESVKYFCGFTGASPIGVSEMKLREAFSKLETGTP